ncbi:AAA family ATPase [Candidatus Dojkabacteria bacterium]|jgi:ATP-dependent Lon protease|nr:AAA family ATPase [Candidatus Dojkabacteria bacterium]
MQPTTAQQNNDSFLADISLLEQKLKSVSIPQQLLENTQRNIERLKRVASFGNFSNEYEGVDKYVDWITRFPWGKLTQDNLDIVNAKRLMDSTHFGMDTVKDVILDYLSVMKLKETQNIASGTPTVAPVMLFVGLQGVGKTSIANSIATAMGRQFVRISLGAIGSVQALRGHPKSFTDSEPGQIVKALVRSQSMNPVILFDEIDKVSGNNGLLNDVMATLLEILDPEQNTHFLDHYIDYPIDLSQVFFICTANNLGGLSAALLDRMEIIRFTSYSDEEKITIAKGYSLPKVIKNTGIDMTQIVVDDAVWPLLVRPVGFDAGLRQLERNIATMIRSAARMIVEGKPVPISITPTNLREFVLPDQGPLS